MLLLVILIILLFGGGYCGYRGYNAGYNPVGLILLLLLVFLLFGGIGYHHGLGGYWW